ncbi:MAG: hypothetical protein O7H41_11455 [Planctomycetota bacterium]|nr:hypothetical protein [Planctomycetota bacterium]
MEVIVIAERDKGSLGDHGVFLVPPGKSLESVRAEVEGLLRAAVRKDPGEWIYEEVPAALSEAGYVSIEFAYVWDPLS